MKIAGIQKTSLIDYPGKLSCTIFLYGCNFKCGFCHNPELVIKLAERIFSEDEVLDFLESRKKYLDGVCFTGGEPLLDIDFDFVKKIKAMGYKIKIDTNGSYPEKLRELINEGLVDYVAMDIKGSRENYSKIVGVDVDLDKIEESIEIIAGLLEYEFRTTIVNRFHDESEIRKMMKWLGGIFGKGKKFVLQGFKNNGKLIDEDFYSEKDVDEDFLKKLKEIAEEYFEKVEIRV